MSNVAKLKKRALEYEQKKQFDRALDTYVQILAELDEHIDEADVALYNRVGDLMLRRGDVSSAVDHYERAVDLYSEGGFFNNAIALCNKILRNAPGRNSIYYKLGKISAKKGFINDAKQNFLEYADRMQRAGELEEAFRALKEFADLCPDQDDIRLMLADQLVRKDRKAEAIEQLQLLYEKLQAEGRTREARATVDRMKAIDPDLEPVATAARPTPKANDLIFLDVNYDEPVGRRSSSAAAPAAPPSAGPGATAVPPAPEPAVPEVDEAEHATLAGEAGPASPSADMDLPLLEVDLGNQAADDLGTVPGLAQSPIPFSDDASPGLLDTGFINGFEQTSLGDEAAGLDGDVPPLGELEPLIGESGTEQGRQGMGDALPPALDIEPIDVVASVFDHGGEDMSATAPDALQMLPDFPEEPLDPAGSERVGGEAGSELTFIYPDDLEPESAAAFESESDDSEEGSGPPLDIIYTPDLEPASDVSEPAASLHESEMHVPLAREPEPIQRVVDRLRVQVAAAAHDYDLRRQFGEALLEDGDREGGLQELEAAMLGFERTGDLHGASAVAEELIHVEPNTARFHQKRVEYAVRANDKGRLADAYLALAECLFRAGQLDKSRAVYGRVLELLPDDLRAQSALAALGDEPITAEPTPPEAMLAARPVTPAVVPAQRAAPAAETPTSTPAAPVSVAPHASAPSASGAAAASQTPRPGERPPVANDDAAGESFVNLSEWLREDEPAKNTRMVVDVEEPDTDDQVDFAEMLDMFKQGVAANVDEADHESHYDLGVAYKEMGLLDEAISEFQKALRGTEQRVRTYEALGQCFVEKGQYQIALTILSRALNDKSYTDDMLVGVLYLLGSASESLGRWQDALRHYERVFAVDIQFRDIGERLAAVERKAQ
jgi:tetratricopeptide (TPR) repeat protein